MRRRDRRDRDYSRRCPRLAPPSRPRRPARTFRHQSRLPLGHRNDNLACNRRRRCCDRCCSGLEPSPRRPLVCGMAIRVYHRPQASRESHFPF